MSISPQQAARELLRRKRARRSLIDFARYTMPEYQPAEHHRLIADKLEAVARGEIKRLRIHMPPRHGKSEIASKRFPAWFLGANPHRNIIAASYGSDLAMDFGREVRNIVGSPEYKRIFDTELRDDSQAANRWHTSGGGMYVAAGVGTAVTGRGAHALLIDDPFKDREEADSERRRETVWRWYTSTAYTRLERDITPDILDDDDIWHDLLDDIGEGEAKPFEGAIIGICTRWHDDDWAGRVEKQEADGGEKWEVLDLPAIMSDGKALWPQKYPLATLENIRDTIGPRDWSALYQQRPAPDEGDYFKREWFKWYGPSDLPRHLRYYGASDYAVTAKGGDYTVHMVCGVDEHDDIYVIDMWRGQTDSMAWVESLLDLVNKWKPLMWGEEKGVIEKTVGPFLSRRMRERKTYFRREPLASVADKPSRSRSFQGRASEGKVYLPLNAPWVSDLMSELLTFPVGTHDDMVDTLGMIGRMLDTMIGGRAPKAKEKPESRWRRALERKQQAASPANWKTA